MIDFAINVYLWLCPIVCPILDFIVANPWNSLFALLGFLTLLVAGAQLWHMIDEESFRRFRNRPWTFGRKPKADLPPASAFHFPDSDDDEHMWDRCETREDLERNIERARNRNKW